jgi:hypothetical protein
LAVSSHLTVVPRSLADLFGCVGQFGLGEGRTIMMKQSTGGMAAALGLVAAFYAVPVAAVGVPGQGTWETTLLGRDINGNAVAADSDSAVFLYDTVLDITWLRSAGSGSDLSWSESQAWVANLNLGGFTGWRLPALRPVNGTEFQYGFSNNGTADEGYAKTDVGWGTASELGHLFYVTLGNKGQCQPNDAAPGECQIQEGYGLTNTGTFQGLSSGYYWFDLLYAPYPLAAWAFTTKRGQQFYDGKNFPWYAEAVRPGDVAAAVPEPQSLALMLAGVVGVAVALRQRHL